MVVRPLAVSVCVLALIPPGGAAQSVGGGVKAGLSLGDIPEVGDVLEVGDFDTSLRTGFAVGGYLTWQFEGGFARSGVVGSGFTRSPRAARLGRRRAH